MASVIAGSVLVGLVVMGIITSVTGVSLNPLLSPEERAADRYLRENIPSYKIIRRGGPWPVRGSLVFKNPDTHINVRYVSDAWWSKQDESGTAIRVKFSYDSLLGPHVFDQVFFVANGHVTRIVDWHDFRPPGETMEQFSARPIGE